MISRVNYVFDLRLSLCKNDSQCVCVCFLGAHKTWRFYPRRGPEIQDTNAKVKVAENLHSPQSKHCLGLELELELKLGPRPALTLIHTHTVAHSARQLWGYLCILSCNCDSVSASTTPALALYLYMYLHLCPFKWFYYRARCCVFFALLFRMLQNQN